MSKIQATGLQFLWIYHILFSVVFYFYLQENGGDAIRYWNLTADISQGAEGWMGYWGRGTFFIQWLNYIPSEVFGSGFLFGNVLYGFISFLGIREIYLVAVKYWPVTSSKWFEMAWLGVFFLPNLHFWSAGVGKEALLILGLGLAVKGLDNLPKFWIHLIIGVVLSFWVRPIAGLVLGGVVWVCFLLQHGISVSVKSVVSAMVLVAGFFALDRIFLAMHLEEYSLEGLRQFNAGQMEFLRGFGAGSEVPMDDYGWGNKLWTFYFRPFWGEVWDIWSLAAVVENSIGFILMIGLVLGLVYGWYRKIPIVIPRVFYAGLAVMVLMGVVYCMTLNNLGIMVRMRSTYVVFLYLSGVFVISKYVRNR
ncbi:hypothetical protein M3O96_19265 [Aquiflexum sp. TKW24L]|uniref:hypothetical protein n=1 Tax=Aquiflexum sp. TKW24L TaxID=2942212 RepID=UPI0020BE3BEA|nr:hypothetical protein [Aquiflexum sp. TKW24L]MCL6261250.1 hypothetical protein [Aquiflexum sp. TKW24L]